MGVGQASKPLKLVLKGAEGRPSLRGAELLRTTHDQSPGVIFPDISAKPSREI